jgi:hypothetical protein
VNLVFSDHVRRQAVRRGITESVFRAVAEAPEQVVPVSIGREARQSRVTFPPDGGLYLVRVIVDVSAELATAVTVYRTSKVDKYWRVP